MKFRYWFPIALIAVGALSATAVSLAYFEKNVVLQNLDEVPKDLEIESDITDYCFRGQVNGSGSFAGNGLAIRMVAENTYQATTRLVSSEEWKVYKKSTSVFYGYQDLIDTASEDLAWDCSGGDHNIAIKTSGTYTISFDSSTEKITLEKREPLANNIVLKGTINGHTEDALPLDTDTSHSSYWAEVRLSANEHWSLYAADIPGEEADKYLTLAKFVDGADLLEESENELWVKENGIYRFDISNDYSEVTLEKVS